MYLRIHSNFVILSVFWIDRKVVFWLLYCNQVVTNFCQSFELNTAESLL